MNLKILFPAFLSILVSTGNNKTTKASFINTNHAEKKNKNKKGILDYHSKLERQEHIVVNQGDKIVAQAQLHYHSKSAGIMDGDGGINLYLEIPSEILLETGKTYDIHNENLICLITNWASPYHSEVFSQNQVKGRFTIVAYRKYEYLQVEFDINFHEPNHGFKNFNDTIEFVLSNPWQKVPQGNINWEGFSHESTEKITLENMMGSWEARSVTNKNMEDKTEMMDTLQYMKLPIPLVIEDYKLKKHLTGKMTEFDLKDNQIILKDEYGTIGFINFLDKKHLTITWKNKYNYQRLHYSKK